MDIAAASIELNSVKLAQSVDVALARKVMDTAKVDSQAMLGMMERSVNPNLGGNIDIRI